MQLSTEFAVEIEDSSVEVGGWHEKKLNTLTAVKVGAIEAYISLADEVQYPEDKAKDYFIQRNGVEFAGTHLLLDLYGARQLDNIKYIEQAMRDIVTACGATLLHIHLHHFSPNGGVSGVAVLAESHISVHTWPERNYAAFDVFMCGDAQPENSVAVLKRAFFPSRIEVFEELRGRATK